MSDKNKQVLLSEVAIPKGIQTGPFGSQLKAEEYTEVGIPVVMPKDIYRGCLTEKNISRISEIKAQKLGKHKIVVGDIIFSRRGDLRQIGVAGNENAGWICGTGCLRARLNSDVFPGYLHQYVRLELVGKWLERNALGQTMLNVNTEIISNLPISLPPLPEQKAIAELLSTWDEAIEKTERLIQAKERLFKWLLRELISEPRNTRKGTEWKKVKLGEVCKVSKGRQLNVAHMKADGEYYALNGGIEPSGRTDDWNTEAETITISEGGNSCGYVNYNTERFWSGGHCYSLLKLKKNVDKHYLYFYLKMSEPKLMRLRVGSGLPNIQKKDVDKFVVALPSLAEQQRISQTLSSAQREIDLLKQLADKYKTQKRGLMHRLLTGEWRIKPEIVKQFEEV